MPLISIIMPAYNAGLLMEESIRSVLQQTFQDWELIIVDDGSVDNTKEIALAYTDKDNRVKYVYQANGRQGKARNNGIRNSTGEYVAFLDADDLWHPEKLEKQISCIRETNADAVFSDFYFFQGSIHSDLESVPIVTGYLSKENRSESFFNFNPIPILTVLARKSSICKVGGFSECTAIQNAEDYHLWLKMMLTGCVFYGMQDNLAYYRKSDTQSTSNDPYATLQVINALQSLDILPDAMQPMLAERLRNMYVRLLRFHSLSSQKEVVRTMASYAIRNKSAVPGSALYVMAALCGVHFTIRFFIKFVVV